MAVTSITEFVRVLSESRLVPAEVVEGVVGGGREPQSGSATVAESPKELARRLVKEGHVTRWQAEQLLGGRTAFFLGKYKLLERIGSGGMGVVLKAEHSVMGRVVAVKVLGKELLARPHAGARFRREMQAAAALSHPNIVTAYDADCVGDTYYLVTEYVEGRDLDSWVKQHGPLPVEWACQFGREVALGLGHADERGMVHRDIKPANLLVTRTSRDGPPTVKILDFGLARFTRESEEGGGLTHTGQVMGTPDFIAPEQALNTKQADIRADIFSLGCTLYFLLTGRLPFAGDNMVERIAARLHAEAPPVSLHRPEVPQALDLVVAKMLAREPAARYQTPYEVAAALAPFCPAQGALVSAEWAELAGAAAAGRGARSPGGRPGEGGREVGGATPSPSPAANDPALAHFLSRLGERPASTPTPPPYQQAMPTEPLTPARAWTPVPADTVGEQRVRAPLSPPVSRLGGEGRVMGNRAGGDPTAVGSGPAIRLVPSRARGAEPPPLAPVGPFAPSSQTMPAGVTSAGPSAGVAAARQSVPRPGGRGRRMFLTGAATMGVLAAGLFLWRPWERSGPVAEAPGDGQSEHEDNPQRDAERDEDGTGDDEQPEEGGAGVVTNGEPQPRDEAGPLEFGVAVRSELSRDDAILSGTNYDEWTFEAGAGEAYRVTLASSDFDTYLYLFDSLGRLLERNDDGPGTGFDSQLVYEAERSGTVHVRASSLVSERFGTYTLLVERAEPIDPDDYAAIAVGQRTTGSLEASDDRFDQRFADRYVLAPEPGETYVITMRADFDTRLYLLDAFGRELASNDDAGGDLGLNSQIVYSFAESGTYVVVCSSLIRGAGGEYGLLVKRADRPDSEDMDQLARLVPGGVVRASLSGSDAQMDDGSYFDLYALEVERGRRYTITARSEDVDPLLFLFDERAEETLDVNDDYPDLGLDSRIVYEAESSGTVLVAVTSVTTVRPSTTGAYTLEVEEE